MDSLKLESAWAYFLIEIATKLILQIRRFFEAETHSKFQTWIIPQILSGTKTGRCGLCSAHVSPKFQYISSRLGNFSQRFQNSFSIGFWHTKVHQKIEWVSSSQKLWILFPLFYKVFFRFWYSPGNYVLHFLDFSFNDDLPDLFRKKKRFRSLQTSKDLNIDFTSLHWLPIEALLSAAKTDDCLSLGRNEYKIRSILRNLLREKQVRSYLESNYLGIRPPRNNQRFTWWQSSRHFAKIREEKLQWRRWYNLLESRKMAVHENWHQTVSLLAWKIFSF